MEEREIEVVVGIAVKRVDAQDHAADVHAAELHGGHLDHVHRGGVMDGSCGFRRGLRCLWGLGHDVRSTDEAGGNSGTRLQKFPTCIGHGNNLNQAELILAVGWVTLGRLNAGLDLAFRFCDLPYAFDQEMVTMLSHSRGPDRPLLELTIGGLLDRTAGRYPDRLAVVARHQSRRMTWAELNEAADRWRGGSGRWVSAAATAWDCGQRTALSGSCCTWVARGLGRRW